MLGYHLSSKTLVSDAREIKTFADPKKGKTNRVDEDATVQS
jgi:hypothetical protein